MNTATTQLRELLQSMTPGGRILAGLLLTVVFGSLGFLLQRREPAPDVYLFGGERLPSSQLDRIEAAIAKRGLSGQQREGNRIRVPSGKKHEYLAAIAEEGVLPRNFHDLMENSLKEGGIWESRDRTRQRLQIAKTETLSEIVRAMNWVEDAVVLYDEQPATGWNRPKQVTGSVNVQPLPGESLTYQRKKTLQRLVAHSVIGLKPEEVAVTSLGDDSSYGANGISPEVYDDVYLRERARFNEHQRTAILHELDYIPGIRVQVNAKLDNVAANTTGTAKPDPKTTATRSTTVKESAEQTTAEAGKQSELEAQGPVRQQEALTAKTNRNKITNTTNQESVVGFTNRSVHKTRHLPTQVWATIAVPRDYLLQVWRNRSPTPAGQPSSEPNQQELDTLAVEQKRIIENLVKPLLPQHVEGKTSTKYVTIEFVDSVTPTLSQAPSLANTAMAWTNRNWGSLSMVGLAVLSLLMLRSVTSSHSRNRDSTATRQEKHPGENHDDSPSPEKDKDAKSTPKLSWRSESSLSDDLVEIVHDDPDAAATILRSWISKAA